MPNQILSTYLFVHVHISCFLFVCMIFCLLLIIERLLGDWLLWLRFSIWSFNNHRNTIFEIIRELKNDLKCMFDGVGFTSHRNVKAQ